MEKIKKKKDFGNIREALEKAGFKGLKEINTFEINNKKEDKTKQSFNGFKYIIGGMFATYLIDNIFDTNFSETMEDIGAGYTLFGTEIEETINGLNKSNIFQQNGNMNDGEATEEDVKELKRILGIED